ncbi:hypothetical protein, partial [Clavibacter zhangzhiyongii]|uniref:hypothetical protein n=1 Tax=Clavibacter zhangzhiyongii TaxID=2768071 RepID=UPI00195A1CEA
RDAERIWRYAVELDGTLAEGIRFPVVATIHPGRQALFHPDPEVRAERQARQAIAFAEVGSILARGRAS